MVTGFTPLADELTGAVEDRLLMLLVFAPLLVLRTLGQPARPNGEVQQPQGMLGVGVALDHQGVLGHALHQGPRGLGGQPPQLFPGVDGDLQPFQHGALEGQRRGAAVALDGLLDVDAEAVGRRLGLGGPRLGLALVRPLALAAGRHEAAAQVDPRQQGGAVPRRYGGVGGDQLDKAQVCGRGPPPPVAHGEDLHPRSSSISSSSASSSALPPAVITVYDDFDHLHGAAPAAPAPRGSVPQLDPAGLVLAAQPPGPVVHPALRAPADAPQRGPAEVRQEVGGGGGDPPVLPRSARRGRRGGRGGWGLDPPGRGPRRLSFHVGTYHHSDPVGNLRKSGKRGGGGLKGLGDR